VTGETNLALYFIQEGRNAEAEALLKDALDLENRAGRPGLATGVISGHLGTLRTQAGDLEEAEHYQRRYVEEMVRVVGAEHARTGEAGVMWAVSLARLGRNGEAVQECHQALAIARAAEPARSPRLPAELAGCAFVLNEAGQVIEAEQDAREALKLLKGGRTNDPNLAISSTELGVALVRQHRYEEAIPELAKGEQIFLDNPGYGAKHYSTIRANKALAAARAGLAPLAKMRE
jgi:tetratricopeptide (TPR) repeat protein